MGEHRLPLLPGQGWFLEDLQPHLVNPGRWSLARLYLLPAGFSHHVVRAAVRDIWQRHGALRIRVVRTAKGWRQDVPEPDTPEPYRYFDLSRVPAHQRRAEIERLTIELHATLDLTAGPMARFAHLDLGDGEAGRLLVNMHHLAADGVSFTLVQSELDLLLAAHAAGTARPLPRAAAYHECVEAVADYAGSAEVARELDLWREQAWDRCPPLPRDFPPHTAHTIRQWTTHRSTLRGPQVEALVQRLPGKLGVDITDILAGAVAETLTARTGGPLCMRLVHHGRSLRREGGRLGDARVPVLPRRSARTVGWLSTFGLAVLWPRTEPDPDDYLRRIAQCATAGANRNTGLILLRFTAPPGPHTEDVTRMWNAAQVMLNFGGVGTRPADDEVLGVTDEAIGHRPDPMEPRLDFHLRAHTIGDELTVNWDYDPLLWLDSTVGAIASACMGVLGSYALRHG